MAAESLSQVFRVLQRMEHEGVIERYAIVGATAILFYAEAVRTYDLDVAVALRPASPPILASLQPVFAWARGEGFTEAAGHLLIHGVPVQFLPGEGGLWEEAVREARTFEYEGVPVRIASPEHLVALFWQASSEKRKANALRVLESGAVRMDRLEDILTRHGIRRPG